MTALPSVLKILTVFVGILIISRLRVPLGLAIILGGIILNIWAGQRVEEIIACMGSTLRHAYLWLLLATIALIVEFGRYMSREQNASTIISLAQRMGGLHGRLWSLMAIPAIIGLVPMPAGALFSAPMINQAVDENHWAPEWKAAINYWFRHVWEYWWPIYPVVIITLAIFRMETWQYMLAMIAFTPVTLTAGYWFLLRSHQANLLNQKQKPVKDVRRFIVVMLPLAVIISCALLMPPGLARLFPGLDVQIRKLLSMLVGMVLGFGIILLDERGNRTSPLFSSIIQMKSLNILLTVAGVILFQSLLKSSDLLPCASHELLQSGIPPVLVVAILPMMAGIVTGVAIGFAGIAFPVVVGLMNVEGSALTPMATVVLAFGFGYMGMMMSPIHLCILVTRDFFSVSLPLMYRRIIPCVFTTMVFSLILYSIFHAFGW